MSEKDKKGEEEEAAAGELSGDTGTSDKGHFAEALEVEQGCLQRTMGSLEISSEAFTREKEHLLNGDLSLASSKVETTLWNHLLTLYKQLQKSAMAKGCKFEAFFTFSVTWHILSYFSRVSP
ncbi:gametogenetin-binding protein 1-like [Pteropus medius]|uniref:gametogenetin-binding protein 1-like n=1 Tax=Pteropus vampyrus TaxID=132908 RepID=UPI00196A8AEA|nr:gametogenetin-binding protein 1-like [Pteropus giganteus]XP_039712252.1 gametogenetin-binding protein 1-like [Pteropus giganteus]